MAARTSSRLDRCPSPRVFQEARLSLISIETGETTERHSITKGKTNEKEEKPSQIKRGIRPRDNNTVTSRGSSPFTVTEKKNDAKPNVPHSSPARGHSPNRGRLNTRVHKKGNRHTVAGRKEGAGDGKRSPACPNTHERPHHVEGADARVVSWAEPISWAEMSQAAARAARSS